MRGGISQGDSPIVSAEKVVVLGCSEGRKLPYGHTGLEVSNSNVGSDIIYAKENHAIVVGPRNRSASEQGILGLQPTRRIAILLGLCTTSDGANEGRVCGR